MWELNWVHFFVSTMSIQSVPHLRHLVLSTLKPPILFLLFIKTGRVKLEICTLSVICWSKGCLKLPVTLMLQLTPSLPWWWYTECSHRLLLVFVCQTFEVFLAPSEVILPSLALLGGNLLTTLLTPQVIRHWGTGAAHTFIYFFKYFTLLFMFFFLSQPSGAGK